MTCLPFHTHCHFWIMIIFSKNISACENEIYHIGKLRESSKRVMFKYISKINNKILTTENALKWMSDFSIANKCNTRNQQFLAQPTLHHKVVSMPKCSLYSPGKGLAPWDNEPLHEPSVDEDPWRYITLKTWIGWIKWLPSNIYEHDLNQFFQTINICFSDFGLFVPNWHDFTGKTCKLHIARAFNDISSIY